MPLNVVASPLFTEAELLDVLTGIDAGSAKDNSPGPSVNVVLNEDVLSSEQAFEDFMESLTSDDDVGIPRVSATSDSSQSESVSSSSSPPAAASKSKRKVDVTATAQTASSVKPKRKRRKHELDHLRAVAAELEKKLKVTRSSEEEQTGGSQIWKHISNQQMTERQKAVGENARLRQLIQEQVRSVKSMQRTLEKTPDLSKMGIAPECSDLTQDQSPAPKELYRDLFKNITSSYRSGVGNLLLQQPCMPPPSLVGKRKMNMEVETVGECGPRMCLQFVESRLIPFSLLQIGDHAWDFLSGSSGHENFQMALQKQGNELFGHCTVNNPSGSMQTLGNIAVRRYYEANKLTFAWECDGLCAQEGDSTMRVHQKGWCVFEPAGEDPQNATIFRACARMTPSLVDNCDSLTESAKSVGQTTEMVIENYEKTVVYIFDAVLDSLACEAANKGLSSDVHRPQL